MGKIREFIKKYKLYSRTNWKVTDYLLNLSEVTDNQSNPIDKDDKTIYTCIRNREGYALYIPTSYINSFYKLNLFYSSEFNYINLTELKRYRIKRNYTSNVYSKVTPPTVKLKFIDYIEISKNNIYIIYTTDLNYDDDLYNDLINYSKIESRY